MANPRFCVKLQDYQPMTKDYGRHIAENIAKGEVFSKRFVTLAVWPNVSGWISPTWPKFLKIPTKLVKNYFHFRKKSPIWPHCILGTYIKMTCSWKWIAGHQNLGWFVNYWWSVCSASQSKYYPTIYFLVELTFWKYLISLYKAQKCVLLAPCS